MKRLVLLCCLLWCLMSMAQQGLQQISSSRFLTPIEGAGVNVPFSIGSEGQRLPVRWGLDVAWCNEQNMRKGINHIGRGNLSLVRSSFRTDAPLLDGTSLTADQTAILRERMRVTNLLSADCDIILNSDQEAGVHAWYGGTGSASVDNWVAAISATVDYIQSRYSRHRVLGISPFNEPDYSAWKQGSRADMKEISRRLKERYPDIVITAGNTLNCDEALGWYNAVKPYVDWGNTHQLAGSFASYANFFSRVAADGNYGYADELHNVGEAMVGVNYGMKAGIWWGFDSRARGEFCRLSNSGSRIGYAENRDKWTVASVYRDDSSATVRAFMGSSERQANTSSFTFISKDREVYFDGVGPTRVFESVIPGGTGYQKGQSNAERVINVDYGADVPPSPIVAGTYKIMNRATAGVASVNGVLDGQVNISQMKWTGLDQQKWAISPVASDTWGDYSFFSIVSVGNGRYMNVLNNSTISANVISYDAGCASNEQWYFEYAGDGCYYIRNRESALYLTLDKRNSGNSINILQSQLGATDAARQLQMWRILPVEAPCEVDPPAAPTGLSAESRQASVCLRWNDNEEGDLAGYMILRKEAGTDDWNTIARKVSGNSYIDNTCSQAVGYEYKIKAIDLSENQSECSSVVEAQPTGSRGLVARWDFSEADGPYTSDATENCFDAVMSSGASVVRTSTAKSGEWVLKLSNDASSDFMQLPYEVASSDELTVALWAYWENGSLSSTQAHLFSFGNGADECLYFMPNSGSGMRFAVVDKSGEQQVNYSTRLPNRTWTHLAVAIGNGRASLFVNGENVANNENITVSPRDIRPVLNYIGRGQSVSTSKFKGYLDDVRIYNCVLSQDEVKAVMDETASSLPAVDLGVGQGAAVKARYQVDGRPAQNKSHELIIIQSDDNTSRKVLVK